MVVGDNSIVSRIIRLCLMFYRRLALGLWRVKLVCILFFFFFLHFSGSENLN